MRQSGKLAADSGYLGCDDKLSPCTSKVGDVVGFKNVIEEVLTITKLGDNFEENSNNQDTQDNNITETVNTYSPPRHKKRQLSQYDNMSPVKSPLKDLNTDQSVLNNLNSNEVEAAKALFAKTLTSFPSENFQISDNRFNLQVNLNIFNSHIDARKSEGHLMEKNYSSIFAPQTVAAPVVRVSYERHQLALPRGLVKNFLWVKLDEEMIGERFYCLLVI